MSQAHGAATSVLAQAGVGRLGRPLRRTRVLLLVAALALVLGLLVYAVDRGTAHTQGLPALTLPAPWVGLHLFGALGAWLPSGLHALAFSLLTAAALPPRPALAYGACVAWCAIDLGFEIGQLPQLATALAGVLHRAGGDAPLVTALSNYFLRGRFDSGDIAATVAGSLLAALLLRGLHFDEESDHGH